MKNLSHSKITFSIVKKLIFLVFCVVFLTVQYFAYPGRLDLSFQNALADGARILQIEVQPDGKVLIGGDFTTRGSIVRDDLARLNADGSVDATFNAGVISVNAIKLQNDGKILVGGYDSLKRLNADGSVDATFNLTGIIIPVVDDIEVQPDGKILISISCGMNLSCSSSVMRLNANGSVELVNELAVSFRFIRRHGQFLQGFVCGW